MNYLLRQYNFPGGESTDFMQSLAQLDFTTRQKIFMPTANDTCLSFYPQSSILSFNSKTPYYFCGLIKYKTTTQKINIKLVNYEDAENKVQLIKSITIPSSDNPSQNYFIDFVFTPITDFNTILFELESNDASANVGCIDIAELKDISRNSEIMGAESPLIRFSIQTRPGFLMGINGEGIRVSKNGIYEIKNGIILVESFSPISHCKYETLDFQAQRYGTSGSTINQNCLGTSAYREFSPFTVDYLYYNNN